MVYVGVMQVITTPLAPRFVPVFDENYDPAYWWKDVPCQDNPALFDHEGQYPVRATNVCRRCPAAIECLADAVRRRDRHTIRGGLLPEERLGDLGSQVLQEMRARRRKHFAAAGLN